VRGEWAVNGDLGVGVGVLDVEVLLNVGVANPTGVTLGLGPGVPLNPGESGSG